ncbi:cora-like Mg2+ transporter protein-domain-containing protein [Phyllosticta capitalensis]
MDPTGDLEMGPQAPQVDAAEPAPDENRSDVNQTIQSPTTEPAELENSSDESDADVTSIEDAQVYVVDFTRTPDGECSYHETHHNKLEGFKSSLQSEETRYIPGSDEAQQLCIIRRGRWKRHCIKTYLHRRQFSEELIVDFLDRRHHEMVRPVREEWPNRCMHLDWARIYHGERPTRHIDQICNNIQHFGPEGWLILPEKDSGDQRWMPYKTAFIEHVSCLLTPQTMLVDIETSANPQSVMKCVMAGLKGANLWNVSAKARCSLILLELYQVSLTDELEILNYLEETLSEINVEMANERMHFKMSFWQCSIGVYRVYLHSRFKLKRRLARSTKSASQPEVEKKRMQQLKDDYEEFSTQLDDVHRYLESTSNAHTGSMSIRESSKAIKEAEEVTKLTQLAFFFIPLTFVAGIFGMNFKEMADLSIWIWAVTSVVLLLASYWVLFTTTEIWGAIVAFKEYISFGVLDGSRR